MVARVSCRKRWFSRTANHRYDVVAIDCGIKYNIIRKLNEKGVQRHGAALRRDGGGAARVPSRRHLPLERPR